MQSSENSGDMITRLARDFLVAVYKLAVLLATGIIVLGKFVFDNLYQLVDNDKKGQKEVRKVVYEPIEENSNK